MEKERTIFSKRLQDARQDHDLKQWELAERADLTPSAISQFESGKREPSFSSIVKLARALDVSPSYLMGLEEYDIDPEVRTLYRKFGDLDEEDLAILRAVAAELKKRGEQEQDTT